MKSSFSSSGTSGCSSMFDAAKALPSIPCSSSSSASELQSGLEPETLSTSDELLLEVSVADSSSSLCLSFRFCRLRTNFNILDWSCRAWEFAKAHSCWYTPKLISPKPPIGEESVASSKVVNNVMRCSWLNRGSTRHLASSTTRRALGHGNARLAVPPNVSTATQSSAPMSRANATELNRVVTRLVKAAEQGPDNPMWTVTPDRGKRLERELIQAVAAGGTSTQHQSGVFDGGRQKPSTQVDIEDMFVLPEIPGDLGSASIGDIRAGFFIMSHRYV